MKRFSGLVLAIVVLTLSACSFQGKTKDLQNPPSNSDNQILLVESNDFNVKITGMKQQSTGMIGPIIVYIGGKARSFDWENVNNPSYYPELTVADLDQDQHQEVVIFLTTGYGTGVRESKAHVLKEDFSKITIPEPKDDAREEISDSLTINEANRVYTITVAGRTNTFTFKEEEAGLWFDRVGIGSNVSYRIDNNQIIASVSVQVSPGMVIGTVEVPYLLVDGAFKREAVSFIPYQ